MITQKRLKELLHYDPSTGDFIWIKRTGPRCAVGAGAGSVKNCKPGALGKKYARIRVLGITYLAHRLAFLYVEGRLPDLEVDHIDGNGLNNRFDNLRLVSRTGNAKNQRLNPRNKTGIPGVRLLTGKTRWMVCIGGGPRKIYLGTYDCFFQACCVKKSAENRHGYHKNHGSVRPK